jgi:hypothetical protein
MLIVLMACMCRLPYALSPAVGGSFTGINAEHGVLPTQQGSALLRWIVTAAVTLCTARFNIKKSYVLPTQCVYVFCVDLRTNSDYFPIQH